MKTMYPALIFWCVVPFMFAANTSSAQSESRPNESRLSKRQLYTKHLSLRFRTPVLSIAHNGDRIWVGAGNEIHVLNENLQTQQRIVTELDFIHDLQLDKSVLVAAGGSPAEHGMIELYQSQTLEFVKRKLLHEDVIHQVDIVNGQLVTASADSKVKVSDLNTLEPQFTYSSHSKRVNCLMPLSPGLGIVSAGMDDTLRVWDLRSGKTQRTLTHHQADVLDVGLKKKEDQSLPMIVSVSRDRTIRFWQPTIGRMVRFLKIGEVPTRCAWLADTDDVFVATDKGQLIRVDSLSLEKKQIADLGERIYSIATFGDRKLLVGTSRHLYLVPIGTQE